MSVKQQRRIQPYLSHTLHKRFKQYVAAHPGASESSIAEAAISEFLDDSKDSTLLLRRLDRQARAIERLERDMGILMEAFSTYMQYWFAHTPEVAEAQKDAARLTSRKRYEDFVAYVADQFAGGHRFVDDLAQDTIADETELAAFAEEGSEHE